MANSNMFVVYTSSSGSNVTISPRTTSSHSPPDANPNTRLQLLEGSGVSNGVMTANVKCSNCNSWSGGTMDFTASKGNWIYAYKSSGGPLNSDDVSAQITRHSSEAVFSWDFANAKGGASVNPLINTPPATTGGAGGRPNGGSTTTGVTTIRASGSNRRAMIIAHGVLASLAFVIFFPVGAILIRVASFPGLVWIHAAFQAFAYVIYIAAVGLGIYIACGANQLSNHHPIIGLVLFAILFFQPALGWMHHVFYKRTGGATMWTHAHVWVGRITVTLGIINGGLGLKLATCSGNGSRAGEIVYGVIAGLMWLVWVACIFIGSKRKQAAVAETSQKLADERRSGSNPGNAEMAGHYDPKQQ